MAVPGIESVRKRPGMYVGDTNDGSGVLHVVLELVANAYDQHLAGRCSRASLEIAADGTVTVTDDGPGIPAAGGDGLPPLHEMLTRLSNTPTVDGHRPHVHLALGGFGLAVVNALSERFEVRSVHGGLLATALYSRGEVVEPVKTVATSEPTGTRIRLRPDPQIFMHPRVSRADLARELEDLSFLAPRFALRWTIEGDDVARGGIAGRVAFRVPCARQNVVTHAVTETTPTGPIDVEIALAWRRQSTSQAEIESFVNLGRTRGHGSHVDGLFDGLREFFGAGKKERFTGLVGAIAVVLADVTFGNPTRDRLDTPEAREPVARATRAALEQWAKTQPAVVAEIRAQVRR